MLTIVMNAINNILTAAERNLKFWEGYYLVDNVDAKIDMYYVINGEDII